MPLNTKVSERGLSAAGWKVVLDLSTINQYPRYYSASAIHESPGFLAIFGDRRWGRDRKSTEAQFHVFLIASEQRWKVFYGRRRPIAFV